MTNKKEYNVIIDFNRLIVPVLAENAEEAAELAMAEIEGDSSIYFELDKEVRRVDEIKGEDENG